MARVLWTTERNRFLAALDNVPRHRVRRRAEMLLAYDTGARVQELHLLDVEDYDPQRKSVMLVNVKAKGRPKREVPLHSRTARAVNAWIRERNSASSALFVSQKGQRLSIRQIQDDYTLVCRLVKIEPQGIHTLRHTSATRLLDDHVLDVHQVSRRLGHTSIMTTFRFYIHGDVEEEARAIQRSRL